jgi:hypothetical protein
MSLWAPAQTTVHILLYSYCCKLGSCRNIPHLHFDVVNGKGLRVWVPGHTTFLGWYFDLAIDSTDVHPLLRFHRQCTTQSYKNPDSRPHFLREMIRLAPWLLSHTCIPRNLIRKQYIVRSGSCRPSLPEMNAPAILAQLVHVIWSTEASYRYPLTLEATIATLSDNHETDRESNLRALSSSAESFPARYFSHALYQ